MTIRFVVPGIPIAQPRQRHRVVMMHGRAIATNYTPKRDPVNVYKTAVAQAASQVHTGAPLAGPLAVELIFVMPRPGRLRWKTRPMPREWHTSKPDADNMAKAVKDTLKGIVWHDDSQVARLLVSKEIAAGDEQPSTTVFVRELSDTKPGATYNADDDQAAHIEDRQEAPGAAGTPRHERQAALASGSGSPHQGIGASVGRLGTRPAEAVAAVHAPHRTPRSRQNLTGAAARKEKPELLPSDLANGNTAAII